MIAGKRIEHTDDHSPVHSSSKDKSDNYNNIVSRGVRQTIFKLKTRTVLLHAYWTD